MVMFSLSNFPWKNFFPLSIISVNCNSVSHMTTIACVYRSIGLEFDFEMSRSSSFKERIVPKLKMSSMAMPNLNSEYLSFGEISSLFVLLLHLYVTVNF